MDELRLDDWPVGMKIVNPQQARNIREQGMIKQPRTSGYIHLAVEIERPHPLKKPSQKKQAIIAQVKEMAGNLADQPGVKRADVFNAFIIPSEPEKICEEQKREHNYDFHIARFDLVVLVECDDVGAAKTIRDSEAFQEIKQLFDEESDHTHCIVAKNPICIDDVDKTRDGVFLFNYFYADGVKNNEPDAHAVMTGVWEYTAGWWTAKANLTNSTPMQPVKGETTVYAIINHCRWDRLLDMLPSLIFRPTLKTFVVANFTANRIVAMPIMYRLA